MHFIITGMMNAPERRQVIYTILRASTNLYLIRLNFYFTESELRLCYWRLYSRSLWPLYSSCLGGFVQNRMWSGNMQVML